MPHFIEFQNVSKIYHMGEVEIPALHDASFTIEKGEICIIVGPSGAGKTTLLNILGGMDRLTDGKVFLDGAEISAYDKKQMTAYRRYDIGFVFQFYNLIQNLTARENVELAAQICKDPVSADEVLEHVGLAQRANNFP
ncbi:MAG: ATP-binding cassette domain-containing protein, partial [Firmicutes bacterium]|nr:ATP-binding cassette domain-containing protein [Bacillota bacterium]